MAARTKPLKVVAPAAIAPLSAIVSYDLPPGKTGVKMISESIRADARETGGVPHLDHGVRYGSAIAIDDSAFDADVRATLVAGGPVTAVLAQQAVVKERPDRLRRRDGMHAHAALCSRASNAVARGPASTISQRQPSAQ